MMLCPALSVPAQQGFVQLVHDTTTNKYRFQRVEVRQYETVSDTLVVDRFTNKWLTQSELRDYQETLIASKSETFNEMNRLRKMAKDELDLHVGFYDGIQGNGAYLALQKEKVKAGLQGNWLLVERSAETTRTDVTIANATLTNAAKKAGTLTINDDFSLTLSSYFNFNLVFQPTDVGWRAERNGKIYFLRKP